ncbi:DMT family transporter [Jannaschia rubra]|uniref:Carboxylate/amino acid/amine transporter n=1 Tax=Jannaschia rubra TaxID=282197 RepID=A0A0M6XSA5_9RHOB|nr:DMT family transporter [Jannaschia rubra]CTQ32924.1 carboxylate/amino acid/amine transporter [Jannaschia rubra]SFG27463.1 hypothetical protein SAMN04488517_103420 [Jannaschia rubra]
MRNRPLAATMSVLGGVAVLGFIDQFVRLIAVESSLWTFHALRTAMIFALAAGWLILSGGRLRVLNWRGVIGRSLVMSTGMLVYFGALGFLPVAQAASGLFSAPIWVMVLSFGLFGLRIGPVRVAAALVGFAGVILVLSPDPANLSVLSLVPVLSGVFYAVAVIATREWCAGEQALTLALGNFACLGLWGLGGLAVISATGAAGSDFLDRGWVTPDAGVLWWTFVQAIGSLGAVVLLTRGYQLAEASKVAVLEYSMFGFSAIFGFLLWRDVLSLSGLLGLALIAGAGALIALRGRDAAQPA